MRDVASIFDPKYKKRSRVELRALLTELASALADTLGASFTITD